MFKKMNRVFAGLLAACILTSLGCFHASAASGRVSFSDPSVTEGDSVSVSMSVSADAAIGVMTMTLTYDSSLLEYVSASGPNGAYFNGGGGSISVSWSDPSGPSSGSFSFSFKTKGSGEAKINVASNQVWTVDEEGITFANGSSTITINPQPAASSEARLSSLKVGSATLSPSFSPDTYEYSATVPAGTKKAVISLGTKDSKATYSISGTGLSVGSNTVTITVKAEDGTTKTYTIRITRPADPVTQEPDEPEEPEEPAEVPVTVTVDGVIYQVAKSLEGITLPEGFEAAAYTYQETEISVAKGLGKPLTLFWLTDENGENGSFYIYDETTSVFYRYRDITSGQKIYTLVTLPGEEIVPAGYVESTVSIGEETVTAWVSEEQNEIVLLYAMNWDGQTGFYRYDTVEQTLQRYVREGTVVVEQPEDTSDEEKDLLLAQNQELQQSLVQADELMHKSKLVILALMAGVAVLLVLIICVLIFTNLRKKKTGVKPPKQELPHDSRPVEPVKQEPRRDSPAAEPPTPAKKDVPPAEDDVDLSKLGLGDVDLSTIDVDDIDFDFDF